VLKFVHHIVDIFQFGFHRGRIERKIFRKKLGEGEGQFKRFVSPLSMSLFGVGVQIEEGDWRGVGQN